MLRLGDFFKILLLILFLNKHTPLCAVVYVSTASDTGAWSGTYLDAYQSSSSGFRGGASTYNPSGGDTLQGFFNFAGGFSSWTSGVLAWKATGRINNVFTITSTNPATPIVALQIYTDLNLGSDATISASTSFILDGMDSSGSTVFLEGNNVRLSRRLTIYNTVGIDGLGHIFTVANTGGFTAGGASPVLKLSNMTLQLTTTTVLSTDIPTTLTNVVVKAGGVSTVGTGTTVTLCSGTSSLAINGNVRFDGLGQRIKVGGAITIGANSTLYVGPGVILTNISSITMTDQTSVLHLDGCELYTGNGTDGAALTAGLTLSKGTLILDNQVQIHNKNYGGAANTNMSYAFTVGGSGSTNYADVMVLGGAYVVVDGCIKYQQS